MDSFSNADPTGVLNAATAAVRLVGTVVQVTPSVQRAVARARGNSTGPPGSLEQDVAGATSSGVTPEVLAAASHIDDEAVRRAYEKVNMVLKTLGERVIAAGLVDIQALARALTQATAHIEVRLFSTETNKLFQSLAQKLNDANLVNSVFTSIYLLGYLIAELTSSLPGWKETYHPLSQRVIQQLFKVALGMDGFKENLGANLDAYKTLGITAGLLRPTDIEYRIFRDFPSFSPCRYSSKGFTDRMNNRANWDKLVKHLQDFGFPQPWQGKDVGMIKDWRFLSSDSNSKAYEVEKADKHIGENFGKVLYWLICSANRMPAGMAVIAYFDQHIQLINWLGPRFGYRVIRAAGDLNMSGPHAQMPRKLRSIFDSWVLVMPSVTLLHQRQQEQEKQQALASQNAHAWQQAQLVAGHQTRVSQQSQNAPQPQPQPQPAQRLPSNSSVQAVQQGQATVGQGFRPAVPSPGTTANHAVPSPPPSSTNSTSVSQAYLPTSPIHSPATSSGVTAVPAQHAVHHQVPNKASMNGQNQVSGTHQAHVSQSSIPQPQHQQQQTSNLQAVRPSSALPMPSHTGPTTVSPVPQPTPPASLISAHNSQVHPAGTPRPQSVASKPSIELPSRQSSTTSSPHGRFSTMVPARKPSSASISHSSQACSPNSPHDTNGYVQQAHSRFSSSQYNESGLLSYQSPSSLPQSPIFEMPTGMAVELPGSAILPPDALKPHGINAATDHAGHQITDGFSSHPGPHDLIRPSSTNATSSNNSVVGSSAQSTSSVAVPLATAVPSKRRNAPPPPRVTLALALYDFEPDGEDEEEFPFQAGDMLEIVGKNKTLSDDGWCRARIKGTKRIGIAPIEYLEEVLGPKPAPARPVSLAPTPISESQSGPQRPNTTDNAAQFDSQNIMSQGQPNHSGSAPEAVNIHQNTSTSQATADISYAPTSNATNISMPTSNHSQIPPDALPVRPGQAPGNNNPQNGTEAQIDQKPVSNGHGQSLAGRPPYPQQTALDQQIDPNMRLASRTQIISSALPAAATLGAAAIGLFGNSNGGGSNNNTYNNNTYNNNSGSYEQNQHNNAPPQQMANDNTTSNNTTSTSANNEQVAGQTQYHADGANTTQNSNQNFAQSETTGDQSLQQAYPGQTSSQYQAQQEAHALPQGPAQSQSDYDPYAYTSIDQGSATTMGISSEPNSVPSTDVGYLTNTDPTTGITSAYPTASAPVDTSATTTEPAQPFAVDNSQAVYITSDAQYTDIPSTYPLSSPASVTLPTDTVNSPLGSLASPSYDSATTTATSPMTDTTLISPLASLAPTQSQDNSYFSDGMTMTSSSELSPFAGMATTQSIMVSETSTVAVGGGTSAYGGEACYQETDTTAAFMDSQGGASFLSTESFAMEDFGF